MENFEFTNTWFNDAAKHQWDKLIPQIKPKKILEIGSYEGRSSFFLLKFIKKIKLTCVDTFKPVSYTHLTLPTICSV